MKTRGFVIFVLATSITAGVVYSQRAMIAERLMAVALPKQMGANQVEAFDDGLHVVLCGAGGPMPAPHASGPCVGIVAGEQFFVVDAATCPDTPQK